MAKKKESDTASGEDENSTMDISNNQNADTHSEKKEALLVKSRSNNGFWRCGMKFTPDGIHITEAMVIEKGWTEDEIKRLVNDPDLICKEVEIDSVEDGGEG